MSGPAAGDNYLNPIQSARIRTINSVTLRYGKVEVRARLPTGDWLW
jgi:beta-glucanase (GH16 family)